MEPNKSSLDPVVKEALNQGAVAEALDQLGKLSEVIHVGVIRDVNGCALLDAGEVARNDLFERFHSMKLELDALHTTLQSMQMDPQMVTIAERTTKY